MPRWYEGLLAGFDTETSGPDPMTARIVSAALVLLHGPAEDGPARNVSTRSWLVAVEEDIPAAATEIHGITTERARAEGRPLGEVTDELDQALTAAWRDGPIIAFNASYDLTVCSAEMERTHGARLTIGPVVDPLVLDRQMDKYRRGSRQLGDVCAHYGVKLGQAHDAGADALAAMRLAWQLGKRYTLLGGLSLADLHERQIGWAREQRASLQEYLRRKDPGAVVDPGWPPTEAFTSGRR